MPDYLKCSIVNELFGRFHYAKNSGNSNGKARSGSFPSEYSEPSLEVVLFDLSDWSEKNLPFHFDKAANCPSSPQ